MSKKDTLNMLQIEEEDIISFYALFISYDLM